MFVDIPARCVAECVAVDILASCVAECVAVDIPARRELSVSLWTSPPVVS